MPSSDASFDVPEPPPERLVATWRVLAARGHCGLVWLDETLAVEARLGTLAGMAVPGAPITGCLVALLGMEDDIRALRNGPDRRLSIPSVGLGAAADRDARVDIDVYWLAGEGRYLVVISRTSPGDDAGHAAFLAESRLRRMAEAEVAAQAEVIHRTNRELATANQDLAEFASVISHDLRAPLRGLRYSATDARAALAAGDLARADRHLVEALARASRMSAMLTGLLDYARIGRKAEAVAHVDMWELAQEIAESARAAYAHEIVVEGAWPVVETLAEPLDIVLRNLVENAAKHHDRAAGRIVLDCASVDGGFAIAVSDDGPGIDPAWHEAIFAPFRQIAESDAAEGAGIGLALVRKTLERLGGSIQVWSDPDIARGATFRVFWPAGAPAGGPGDRAAGTEGPSGAGA